MRHLLSGVCWCQVWLGAGDPGVLTCDHMERVTCHVDTLAICAIVMTMASVVTLL